MRSALQLHPSDARLEKGRLTRAAILDAATQIASVEGLQGLSLARLAEAVGMSKSGLFAHFRSKEDLQLAVIDAARALFLREVVVPSQVFPEGLQRLRKLVQTWLSYAEGCVFRGGCFFMATSLEFDGRPGVVRDRIRELMGLWLSLLESEFRRAKFAGELRAEADESQLAFEFNAQGMAANWGFQLFGDRQAFARARSAMLASLEKWAARPLPEPGG